jgi:hypothetical protein
MTRSFVGVVNYLSAHGSVSSTDGVQSGLRAPHRSMVEGLADLAFVLRAADPGEKGKAALSRTWGSEPQLSPEQAKRAAGGNLEQVIGSCRRGDLNPHGLCAH